MVPICFASGIAMDSHSVFIVVNYTVECISLYCIPS